MKTDRSILKKDSNEQGDSTSSKKRKNSFFGRFPIVGNLLIMFLISIILIFVIMAWLDSYTRHGKEELVPNIINLPFNDAKTELLKAGFEVEVVDSIYTEGALPGAVHLCRPEPGSYVKPGRLIFITLNAFNKPKVKIPDVSALSKRIAEATLKNLGFKFVTIEYVSGQYNDLTKCVTDQNDKEIPAGTPWNLDQPLKLKVYKNNISLDEPIMLSDSILLQNDSFAIKEDTTVKKVEEKLSKDENWW